MAIRRPIPRPSIPDLPVERLTDRYVSGSLTEDEFERHLALELDGPDGDEIDRELQRSRTK